MANDVGIRVGVEGEKQFKDSIKGINSQLRNLNTEMEASKREFKDNADSQQALKEKADILGRTVDTQKQKVELLSKQYETQKTKLSKLGEELDRVTDEFGENSTQASKAENAYNRQATQVNNLGSQLNTAKSDLKNFETQMQETTTQSDNLLNGLKRAEDGLGKFSEKASKVGGTLTKYVTTPLLGLGVLSFKSASDLNENLNKTEVAFRENADAIVKWSETTLKQYGLSQNSALEMAATWGDMGTSMELPLDTATEMSKELVGLAADMASFKNISVERAQTALSSVYTGETESLKALGIVMTEANLEAYAMSKGISKSYKDMSQAEKVTLRYQYVLDKTKNAQGDFARTSDGAANQMRIAQESAKELAASFGQKLLPVGTKLLKFANNLLDSFNNLDDGTKDLIINLGVGAAAAGPLIKGIGKITDVGKGALGAVSKLAGKIKGLDGDMGAAKNSTGFFLDKLKLLASPTGIAVAAAGIIAGLATEYYKANTEAGRHAAEIDDLIQKINDEAGAIEAAREEQQKNVEQADSEYKYYQNLYDELTNIVDANGKIQEGYEGRAQFILNELGEAYGIETEIIDGVIQKYEDLTKAIQEQHDNARANALLSELEPGYTDALKKIDDARKNWLKTQKELDRLNGELKEKTEEYGWGNEVSQDEAKELFFLRQRIEELKSETESAKSNYEQYQDQITTYESASAALQEKRYEDSVRITRSTLDNEKEYVKSSLELKKEELKEETERANSLQRLYEKTGDESVRVQLEASQARVKILEDEIEQSLSTAKDSENVFVQELYSIASSGSSAYGDNFNLETPTLEQISLIQEALSDNDPAVSGAAHTVAQGMVAAFTSEDPAMQKAGNKLITTFQNALGEQDEELRKKGVASATIFAVGLRSQNAVAEAAGKEYAESFQKGFEAVISKAGAIAQAVSSGLVSQMTSRSTTPFMYSRSVAPQMAPEIVAFNAEPALTSEPSYSISRISKLSLNIGEEVLDVGRQLANAVERRMSANINPARQEIAVSLPAGKSGTTLNQTNNFYSPEALSPAETARLNRNNVRNTIRMLRS